jgi:hypothetical protein
VRKLILCVFLWSSIAQATNFDTTWAGAEWNTTWADADIGTDCDTTNSFVYSATGGNTGNCRIATCTGRNDVGQRESVWAGTWETLGVTAGWTVSTVQFLDMDTQLTTDTGCDSAVFGPVILTNSADTVIGTMWEGRTATTQEAGWTAEGADPAISVGASSASNSSIKIRIKSTLDIANSTAQSCVATYDNLDIRIVASSYTRKRVYNIGMNMDGKITLKSVEDL